MAEVRSWSVIFFFNGTIEYNKGEVLWPQDGTMMVLHEDWQNKCYLNKYNIALTLTKDEVKGISSSKNIIIYSPSWLL